MSQEKRQTDRLVFRPQPKPAPRAREDERLRAARERAAEYRAPKEQSAGEGNHEQSQEEHKGVRPIEEWEDMVSKRIDEAIRRGDFDNLPGHGKPLRVGQEPFVPGDQQMAFTLLKNNDMTPTWIAERKEMLSALEKWREDFRRVVGEAHSAWVSASSDARRVKLREQWARWLTRWESEIAEINRRVGTVNLKQPVTRLEIFKLRLDDELRQVGMTRTLGEQTPENK